MFTKSTPREKYFAPGTSRDRDTGFTLRLTVARDTVKLLEMGARIRELREQHGFKQQWIADQVGVELRTYQFWQAGSNQPEQEHLEKLAELFGVTPKYLLSGETPEMLASRGDQLDRIEEKLDRLLTAFELDEEHETPGVVAGAFAQLLAIVESQQTQAPEQPKIRTATRAHGRA